MYIYVLYMFYSRPLTLFSFSQNSIEDQKQRLLETYPCDIWHWQTDAGKQIFFSTLQTFVFHPVFVPARIK